MSLVPCPDCFQRISAFGDRGNGQCKPCRGTGEELGVIAGLVYGAIDAATGKTTKCHACRGNKTCQTCGGRGEISEERGHEVSDSQTIPHDVRGERQSKSAQRDTSQDVGSSPHKEPSRPSYGGGGGGGGDGPGIQGLAAILLFGIAVFLGWNYKKNHPEHYEVDIAVLDAATHQPIRFLEYRPGVHQRVY